MSSSPDSSLIVIDAGVGVAQVLTLPYTPEATQAWSRWSRETMSIFAPSLWHFECVTAIRKTITFGAISLDEASTSLDLLQRLKVKLIPPDTDLSRAALRWAGRLNQRAAYDSYYVALAERSGAELWSSDRRLVNGARQAGATWVHWIGEAVASEADIQSDP
jgi:predicted nucleic acid-binding protein